VDRSECRSTRSTVAIGSHPVHVMLVAWPITLLVGVLAIALTHRDTGDHFGTPASEWLLAGEVTLGALGAHLGFRSLVASWFSILVMKFTAWRRLPVNSLHATRLNDAGVTTAPNLAHRGLHL
jgi:uncharacterized membrane protein